jgi:hypothetical protein
MAQNKRCAFCYSEDVLPRIDKDFHSVCVHHNYLRNFFLINVARKKYALGVKSHKNIIVKCSVCFHVLTTEELNSVEPNHLQPTCLKHRKYAFQFILNLKK